MKFTSPQEKTVTIEGCYVDDHTKLLYGNIVCKRPSKPTTYKFEFSGSFNSQSPIVLEYMDMRVHKVGKHANGLNEGSYITFTHNGKEGSMNGSTIEDGVFHYNFKDTVEQESPFGDNAIFCTEGQLLMSVPSESCNNGAAIRVKMYNQLNQSYITKDLTTNGGIGIDDGIGMPTSYAYQMTFHVFHGFKNDCENLNNKLNYYDGSTGFIYSGEESPLKLDLVVKFDTV